MNIFFKIDYQILRKINFNFFRLDNHCRIDINFIFIKIRTNIPYLESDIKVIILFLIVFYLVFFIQNIYQILIRYFDYYSILKIVKSIFLCTIILIPLNFCYIKIYIFQINFFIAPIIIGLLILFHRIF